MSRLINDAAGRLQITVKKLFELCAEKDNQKSALTMFDFYTRTDRIPQKVENFALDVLTDKYAISPSPKKPLPLKATPLRGGLCRDDLEDDCA